MHAQTLGLPSRFAITQSIEQLQKLPAALHSRSRLKKGHCVQHHANRGRRKFIYLDLGTISDIVLDVRAGRIAYAVLSESGFLGMGTSLHAIPWNALTLDTDAECFHVSIAAQRIKDDPGFDKDHWTSMADASWVTRFISITTATPTGQLPEIWATQATGESDGVSCTAAPTR